MSNSSTTIATVGTTTTSSTTSSLNRTFDGLKNAGSTQTWLMVIGLIIVIAGLQLFSSNQKGKIATGYWGGAKEKSRARKKAKTQMAKVTRNNVALYVGMPTDIRSRLEQEWIAKGAIAKKPKNRFDKIIKPSPTLYLPDAQRGTSVAGAAGSGKTFSVIDPLIRSSLDQGFPTIIYDFKYPSQTKRAVAYAMKRGYTVRVFAPGFPESEICNPLDLIRNEEDAVAAGQFSQVVSKNFDRTGGSSGSGDKFFEEAGDNLVEGILLVTKAIATLTKQTQYCDLMMAQAILSLGDLPHRLEAATNNGTLKVWTTRPLSQVVSVKDSEKTVAGIIGTAQRLFLRFLKKDFIGAFCGQTTLPLDIDGKQLVIFGLDRNNRDIVGPLLAAILHMIIARNVSRTVPRKDPLVVVLDELPTLYLPQLVNWLNENREDGFCGILGYQNIAQLEKVYGKELARAIFGGTACKFLFNPQDGESAKIFADYLGEQEVEFKSKSRSYGKGGGSRSTNDNRQKRHLIEPSQMLKLKTGRAVVINPAYERGKEAYVPLLQSIKVPQEDIDEMAWAEQMWDIVRARLIEQNRNVVSDDARREQFEIRQRLAEELFPLPAEPSESGFASLSDAF
ncbi:type IV secretory system conjugative DNA transfer family protein [Oculatella sp. LEGE 06141]|uniref:type IV secretory system conjugative DNA transfer family protein n=1 Tax=Oculatella sp. LEGE 06141 TaxID=1828648 RepID=UPI001882432F|nr:type IV secretion system DNA-binding domain-containing protein [Oculatella sp. LEGE 06141]MBE9180224.1 type IV secretory system conjugative DNA transfer family protein [Oculatella sp. LEGE 06141]